MSNEFKRVKHGQQPGDISKQFKIAMREKQTPIVISSYQVISSKAAKTFRRMIAKKGRKVQRQRDHRAERENIP